MPRSLETCLFRLTLITPFSRSIAVDNKPKDEVAPEENYDDYPDEIATFDSPIALLSMGDVQVMSATAQSESSYVSQSVTATIVPSTVVDKYVTWSIAWASDAALKNEDISNYVQIAEGSQGNLTCTLNCLKAFRGSKAILTCITRQGGKGRIRRTRGARTCGGYSI